MIAVTVAAWLVVLLLGVALLARDERTATPTDDLTLAHLTARAENQRHSALFSQRARAAQAETAAGTDDFWLEGDVA